MLASVFSGTRSGRAAVEKVAQLSDDPLARTLWRRFDTQGARKATFNTSMVQARMYKVLGASPADSKSFIFIFAHHHGNSTVSATVELLNDEYATELFSFQEQASSLLLPAICLI